MKIHKNFVEQILIKRKAALRDLLIGEESLNLTKLKPDMRKLIDELDRVFYTLEFLERNNLIIVKRFNDNRDFTLFDGFEFKNINDAKYTIHYFANKLKEENGLNWNIEMGSGLTAFKNNKFRTDEQVKEERNFWLAIGVGIGSATITAILSAILTKSPIIYCFK